MIAPNNHLPFRRAGYLESSNICRHKVKLEIKEITGKDEEEEDRENSNKPNNIKE